MKDTPATFPDVQWESFQILREVILSQAPLDRDGIARHALELFIAHSDGLTRDRAVEVRRLLGEKGKHTNESPEAEALWRDIG